MINMDFKNYNIKSDSHCFTVTKKRVGKDKNGLEKESVSIVGYFVTLSKALKGIQKDYVLTGDKEITDVKQYRSELEKITQEMEERLEIAEENK